MRIMDKGGGNSKINVLTSLIDFEKKIANISTVNKEIPLNLVMALIKRVE